MKTATVSLVAVLAVWAGACASNPAPQEPEIVSSGTRDGRGYPAGSSVSGPSMALSRTASSAAYGYSPEEPVLVE